MHSEIAKVFRDALDDILVITYRDHRHAGYLSDSSLQVFIIGPNYEAPMLLNSVNKTIISVSALVLAR